MLRDPAKAGGNNCFMSLAERIKKYRRQKEISQDKLARLAGVALSTLTKIESGAARQPTFDTVMKIADALGVSLDGLIARKAKKSKN